ncbi:MAG: polysaccharide deacetylase family protein [Bacteroidales bacterium]
MNRLFYTLAKFSNPIPLSWILALTRQNVVHPFYHTVSDRELPHIKHLYQIRDTATFERDLDFLLAHFEPISVNDYISLLEYKKSFKKPVFVLSFDDGLREFHDTVAPILLRKGIPAICFVNSGFIDNKALFYRYKVSLLIGKLMQQKHSSAQDQAVRNWFAELNLPSDRFAQSLLAISYDQRAELDKLADILGVDFDAFLRDQQPYLTTNQIVDLQQKGFSFGAHSIDHPRYAEIDLTEQIRQTTVSVEAVSSAFGTPKRLFSFPFSDDRVGHLFFDTIFASKSPIADFTFGCSGLKHDSVNRNIQRIPIEIGNHTAQEVIYGEQFYYLAKSFLNKNSIERK